MSGTTTIEKIIANVPKPMVDAFSPAQDGKPCGVARVFADGAWQQVQVYDRAAIGVDAPIPGSIVISENYSTIFLPRGWQIAAAVTGDLMARRE